MKIPLFKIWGNNRVHLQMDNVHFGFGVILDTNKMGTSLNIHFGPFIVKWNLNMQKYRKYLALRKRYVRELRDELTEFTN